MPALGLRATAVGVQNGYEFVVDLVLGSIIQIVIAAPISPAMAEVLK